MRPITMPAQRAGHSAPITHVAFRGDGARLATSSYDGSVIVWDTTVPKIPRQLARLPHRRLVNAAAWHPSQPGLIATASADKTVMIWHVGPDGDAGMANGLARHTDDINSVAWLPDGQRLACVSEDGTASLWEALTGRFLGMPVAHGAHCMMVAASASGLVATVGEDGKVTVFSPDGVSATRERVYKSSVEGCAWSHRGDRLALARDDGTVDVLDPDLRTEVSVPVTSSAARSVAWSPDDTTIVTGGYDGAVHFLDADGGILGSSADDRMWPRSVSTAPGMVAVGSFWSTPHLLDFDGTRLADPAEPTHGPNALAVHGRELLIGCDSGTLLGVDLDTLDDPARVAARTWPAATGPVLSLDADGDGVFAGTYSGHLLNVERGSAASPDLGAPVPSVLRVADLIVGGTYNGELAGADPGSLAIVHRSQPHEGSVKSMAALAGEAFVTGATDRVVAAGTLRERTPLWEHGNLVNSVTTLDGTVVASGSRDHTVKVGWVSPGRRGGWDVSGCATLLGPDESVKCVTLLGTADAPVVLAGSYDYGLYCWQVPGPASPAGVRTGEVVTAFGQAVSHMCRIDPVTAAVAAWDGQVAIIGIRDGSAHVIARLSVPSLIGALEKGRRS
jgi:toxoflavin biosynthesis protein ToxC